MLSPLHELSHLYSTNLPLRWVPLSVLQIIMLKLRRYFAQRPESIGLEVIPAPVLLTALLTVCLELI